MRKVVYTFGGGFETTDYELAERMRTEKKINYGVRLDDIEYTPARIRRKQIELGIISEDDE